MDTVPSSTDTSKDVTGTDSTAAADPALAATADLRWGIKSSFVEYIGMLSDGVIETRRGARRDQDGSFVFPLDDAASRFSGGRGVLAYTGEVVIRGHWDMLYVALVDPHVELGSDRAVLTAVDPHSGERIALAALAARPAEGQSRWSGVEAALTEDGVLWLGDKYPVGEVVDSVAFSVA